MIELTRLNHVPLVLNSDLIEHVEVTPDTVITLTTGQRFLVLESSDEVVQRVIAFRKAIAAAGCCVVQTRVPTPLEESKEPTSEVAGKYGG
jgi:flagellar protein FlbD